MPDTEPFSVEPFDSGALFQVRRYNWYLHATLDEAFVCSTTMRIGHIFDRKPFPPHGIAHLLRETCFMVVESTAISGKIFVSVVGPVVGWIFVDNLSLANIAFERLDSSE